MSLTITNNAKGGTHGTAITYGNTGEISGEAWDYFVVGAGTSITFVNAPSRGGMAYEFKTTTSGQVFVGQDLPFLDTVYIRFFLYLTSYTSGARVCHLNDTIAPQWSIGIRTDGRLSIRDSATTQMSISTLPVPLNRWVRIEARVVCSATTGASTVRLYTEPDSPYPAENIVSTASFNTKPGTDNFRQARFGVIDTSLANYTCYMDGFAITDNAYPGPADANYSAPLLRSNNAETGTHGAAVTSVNSGNNVNQYFQVIEPSTTIQYSNLHAAHGSLSYEFISSSGVENRISWRSLATSSAALRFYGYFTAYPPSATGIGQFTTNVNAGFDMLCFINLRADGKITASDRSAVLWTSTPAIALNTWYRFEMWGQIGATPTTGNLNVAFYSMDSPTALDSFTTSSANLGAEMIEWARYGKLSANTWTNTFYMDDFAVRQAASGYIGPYSGTPAAPSAFPGIIPHLGWGREA